MNYLQNKWKAKWPNVLVDIKYFHFSVQNSNIFQHLVRTKMTMIQWSHNRRGQVSTVWAKFIRKNFTKHLYLILLPTIYSSYFLHKHFLFLTQIVCELRYILTKNLLGWINPIFAKLNPAPTPTQLGVELALTSISTPIHPTTKPPAGKVKIEYSQTSALTAAQFGLELLS